MTRAGSGQAGSTNIDAPATSTVKRPRLKAIASRNRSLALIAAESDPSGSLCTDSGKLRAASEVRTVIMLPVVVALRENVTCRRAGSQRTEKLGWAPGAPNSACDREPSFL